MELARPFNLLMPLRGNRITVRIHGALEGELPANIKGEAAPKMIPTTRLFTTRVDRPSIYANVDVTCSQPRAMLEGFLRSGALVNAHVEFRASGRGRTRRDTIHIKPIVP